MEAQYPVSVITDGAGLNVTVMSYPDRVDFGVVADREQMPDLRRIVTGAREALDDLDALVTAAAKPAAAKGSASRKPKGARRPPAAASL